LVHERVCSLDKVGLTCRIAEDGPDVANEARELSDHHSLIDCAHLIGGSKCLRSAELIDLNDVWRYAGLGCDGR
jgi:hypothetical protein